MRKECKKRPFRSTSIKEKEGFYKRNVIKRAISLIVMASLIFAIVLPISVTKVFAASNPIPNGWYMIVSGNSNDRVLDINNWSQANGGNLETYTKNNTTNQRFYLQYINGYYTIKAQHSGKYLHKANAGTTDDVHQWAGAGWGYNQTLWAIESAGNGYYYIRSKAGNYLDNSNGSTKLGNNVITHPFNGSNAQKWKFLSTSTTVNEKKSVANGWYMIESGNSSDRVLDINNWSQDNGGNLETYKKNGTTNQVFYLQYHNDGYYTIKAKHSGKYLHKANSGYADNVHQWDGAGAMQTLWALEPAGNGYYYIRSKSGNYMDNAKGSTNLGNNVITYWFNGSNAQKWKFVSTSVSVTYETYYVTANSGLVLRKGRGTNYDKILTMPNGAKIQVEAGSISGGWAKAKYNGSTGYCSTSYISKTKPSTSTGNTSYAPYKGIDYTKQINDTRRINALRKAQRMVTLKWVSPASFVTWSSSKGSYNTVTAENAGSKPVTKYEKGKTYVGIPYSMINHSYDETAWANYVKKGFKTSDMEKTMDGYPKKGTARGVDCSYFVYLCLKAGGANITYKNTNAMLKSSYYTKIAKKNMKPGDILLKSGHVMLFVGKSGNNYAVFEATASGSKTRYKVYTETGISSYNAYKYKFW